jgi:hypothetical protein
LPFFSTNSVKQGKKIELREPSPKKRRNRLGKVNAKKKASKINPAPKTAAKITSRISPKILDPKIEKLTVPKFFAAFPKILFCLEVFCIQFTMIASNEKQIKKT